MVACLRVIVVSVAALIVFVASRQWLNGCVAYIAVVRRLRLAKSEGVKV